MDKISRRVLNPWWFETLVVVFTGVGYLTGGRFDAIEGAVIVLVLAHGARC
jgi:hypothetical protein